MNKNAVYKILNKGKISGDELGRLILLNSIEEQLTYTQTGRPVSLFVEDDLRTAERGLSDYERKVYSGYIGLYTLVHSYFNILQGEYQQVLHAFYRLLLGLVGISYTIETSQAKEKLPLIMTQEYYNEQKGQTEKELKDYKESYIGLFIEVLSQYTIKLEENPDAKTPITEIFKAYKDKPAKDKTLIELYKEDNRDFYIDADGQKTYYLMTDGRPSTEVKMPEFIDDFLSRPLLKGLEDKERIKDRYLRPHSLVANLQNDNELLKEKADALKKYEEMITGDALPYRVKNFIDQTIHYLIATDREEIAGKVEELEAELFINEIIPTKADFLLYWGFINTPYTEEKENLKVFNLYLKELPELAEVITKELLNTKGLEALKDISPKDYAKEVIKWEDLCKKNLFDYKARSKSIFYADYRQGIAILDDNSISKDKKEKMFAEGFYKSQKPLLSEKISELLEKFSERELLREAEPQVQNTLLIPALRFIYAVNTLLEDLEEIYKLEGLKDAFGIDTREIETKIKLLNFYISIAEDQIIEYVGWDTKEGIKARELLNCNYKIILLSEHKPTEEKRKEARAYISDITNFRNNGTSNKFYKMYIADGTNTNFIRSDNGSEEDNRNGY